MTNHIVIVAGGKGMRMGGDIPKQFMLLADKPILMHTIERFHSWSAQAQIIVVLPAEQHGYWLELCRKYHFSVPHRLAKGGETRFHSVRNGLQQITDGNGGYVAIHDGVRPFVAHDTITRCFEAAKTTDGAIPAVDVVETLRHRDGHNVNRSDYQLVQTPQTFPYEVIANAYSQDYRESFTDDASVVEAAGKRVTTVEGNRENIKITTPFDMVVAEAIVASLRK